MKKAILPGVLIILTAALIIFRSEAQTDADHVEHESHSGEIHGSSHEEEHQPHEAKVDEGHSDEEHDSHSEEEHEEHDSHGKEAREEHSDNSHEMHGEDVIVLSEEAENMAGVRLDRTKVRKISKVMEFPGEVGFNEDRKAHVTPRYGGVVREVKAHLGQYVREGETLAVIENNETLNRYGLKAAISGTIIKKDITRGEFASRDRALYVIADLSTVWIDLDIYPGNMDKIDVGSEVTVSALGVSETDTGKISYIAPVFDRKKRSAGARVVLRNRDNRWRPGTFVSGRVEIESDREVLTVVNSALQILDGKKHLFIPGGEGFRPLPVTTGAEGEEYTEIVEGIKEGREYVSNGAFELKAAVVTSSLGSHAGHGH